MESAKLLVNYYPVGSSLTNIYTVAEDTTTIINSLVICNQGSVMDKISVALAPGATTAVLPNQYIFYYNPIGATTTYIGKDLKWTINNSEIIRIYSEQGTSSFLFFGVEVV